MVVNTTEVLISSLNCMKFKESEYAVALPSNIFKTANKFLFQRIVCFTLSQFGEFDEFVGKYKYSCALPTKVEAQFRSLLKDVVTTINGLYPGEYYLKPINQSFLIAPQGTKVLEFLSSLCKIALSVKLKRAGFEFIPPTNVEELLAENELAEVEDINTRIEKAETQLKLACLNDPKSSEELTNCLKDPYLLHELKGESELENVEMAVQKWEQALINDVQNCKCNIEEKKSVFNQLEGIIDSFNKLKDSIYYSFDGLTVLNDLGFKSNVSAKINEVELIENGMLDLNSLFKAALAKYNSLLDYVKMYGSSTLNCRKEELTKVLFMFDEIKDSFQVNEMKLNEINTNYMPVIRKYQEDALKIVNESEDPLHIRLRDYVEFERSILEEKENCEVMSMSGDELLLPEEDLVTWILGDKIDKLEVSSVGSVRKSSNKLARNLSFSGRKLSTSMSKRKIVCEEKANDIAKGVLLRGLCEDRRATLASPSARRERFKIKRYDDQRKPLKPVTAKGLFSSSPLGHSSTSKNSTTLDLSPVKCLPEAQDLTASFLSQGCGLNLHRSLSEPALELTQEMLKWEHSSSDSDPNSPMKPFAIPVEFPQSPQLDDSINLLISRFKSAKEKFNLSE